MSEFHFKPGHELSFNSVLEVRKNLYQILNDHEPERFNLDLSDVQHCDSAGMALLIEVSKWCKKNNKIFEIIGMSEKTQSLAEFCGVKDVLDLKI